MAAAREFGFGDEAAGGRSGNDGWSQRRSGQSGGSGEAKRDRAAGSCGPHLQRRCEAGLMPATRVEVAAARTSSSAKSTSPRSVRDPHCPFRSPLPQIRFLKRIPWRRTCGSDGLEETRHRCRVCQVRSACKAGAVARGTTRGLQPPPPDSWVMVLPIGGLPGRLDWRDHGVAALPRSTPIVPTGGHIKIQTAA
ncbi:unnamed protein product [Urochloa humidicola]